MSEQPQNVLDSKASASDDRFTDHRLWVKYDTFEQVLIVHRRLYKAHLDEELYSEALMEFSDSFKFFPEKGITVKLSRNGLTAHHLFETM